MNGKILEFKLGELFCGAGGLSLGAHLARVKHNELSFRIRSAWGTDYHHDSCETYSQNITRVSGGKVICEDIRKLEMSEMSPIDALAFGFPCNDFSIVGEQRGIDGTYGPLYSFGVKALRMFRPSWFIAENVGGLRNANEGQALMKILHDLKESGYVITPHLYKFELYGVPQARHRIIIVGIRNDLNLSFSVPSPTTPKPRTCRDAIENPPISKGAFNNELTRQSDVVVRRLQHIKPGENAFNAELPKHLRLNVAGAKISQIYRRLDPDKPAYTITGSGGGGTHVYHWDEDRALTNRERARLQTFPDDYQFIGSKESVRRQIGMAVPPLGVKVIFQAILKTFAGLPYSSCDSNFQDFYPKNGKVNGSTRSSKVQKDLFETCPIS